LSISFKSIGDLSTDRKFQISTNELPIGIKTPMQLGQGNDGIFAMHYKSADQIQDNFKNLLLTNWGERLSFYDFGANLKELTMELSSEDFDNQAMTRIKSATSKWMPFIDLLFFDKDVLGRVPGQDIVQVRMKILYAVPKMGITNKGIELTFFLGA